MRLTRITVDPQICTGKPCIRGLRFPVARLLGLLAAGETKDQILAGYPYLEPEDIDEALYGHRWADAAARTGGDGDVFRPTIRG